MRKAMILAFSAVFFGLVLFAHAQKGEKKAETDPSKALAESVKNGMRLFDDKSLGTSGMTCNSCHMEGGTKEGKMGDMVIPAWDNLTSKYPKYFSMAKRVMTLDQVINWCIVNPLKGKALSWDDQRLTDLTAYVASVKVEKKK